MKPIATALGLALLAAPAFASDAVYPVTHVANYCPNGLQPVYAGGEICCGTPTTHTTYSQVMSHPVARKKMHHQKKVVHHIPAEKGIPTHKGID